MNYAVLGAAYSPGHLGHADVISNALIDYDKVFLVPSYAHAFGKKMIDFDYKVELLKCIVELFPKGTVEISLIEKKLHQHNKPVYTFDVLEALNKQLEPADSLTFIIGPDNADNWDSFYKASEIKKQWGVKVYPERKQIRSTKIRALICSRGFKESQLHGLVPPLAVPMLTAKTELWKQLEKERIGS